MAGLYVHIPFCKSRCCYCDFFSTTLLGRRQEFVDALCLEIQQADIPQPISTIYIGGGTPSQLDIEQLQRIFRHIYIRSKVDADAEITFEANPDDLTSDFVAGLRTLPVNRLSMGIQSFNDRLLRFMHRRHTASEAIDAVKRVQDAGFGNVSIDLMFGFPSQMSDEWDSDLDHALQLGVQHVSAYSLMYEDGTPLTQQLEQGRFRELDEETSRQMYAHLVRRLREAGFQHYEISNFARPGFRSRHNSAYWDGTPYLGFGPAAHSYDGRSRFWNPADLDLYITHFLAEDRTNETRHTSVATAPASAGSSPEPSMPNKKSAHAHTGRTFRQRETLSTAERYNERVLTRLRTCEGIDLRQLRQDFGETALRYFLRNAQPHLSRRLLRLSPSGDRAWLTERGILVSNDVMADLMAV